MKIRSYLLLTGLILLTCSFKIGYTWAQAWVDDKVLSKKELSRIITKHVEQPNLTLVLLSKKHLIKTPSNGSTYLHCYLINNTDTSTLIERADATITKFSTEIYKNHTWQLFQTDIGSSCGNSYWTQELEKGKALSIQLDHAENGPIRVLFRIKYEHNGTKIYSNTIKVDIDKKNYDRAGKPLKRPVL